jgi:hypothetical protein
VRLPLLWKVKLDHPETIFQIGRNIGHDTLHHNALKSSGTSPNFRNTVASWKSPVAGSPVRLNATTPPLILFGRLS